MSETRLMQGDCLERMSMDKLRAAATQRAEHNDEQAAKADAAA